MKFQTKIEYEAQKAAEVRSIDEKAKKAFIAGAQFAISYLNDRMSVCPMEDTATERYLDELRLKDVREAVHFLLTYQERENDQTP